MMERWLKQQSENDPSKGENKKSENFELYKRVFDFLPVVIFVLDKNDRIVYFNHKFQQTLGYDIESLPDINLKKIIKREDWNLWNENLFKLSNLKEEENCVFSLQVVCKDESEKRLNLKAKVFEKNINHLPELYLFSAEEDELKNNNKINKKIQPHSALEEKLQTTIDDLGRSNKELEEFAYLASHDLQEPLRKITVFTSRLQAKFEPQLGDEGKKYIERINVAADGMRSLIDGLLQISRTIQYSKPFVETDLNRVVEKVIQNLDLKIEEGKVQIYQSVMPVVDALPSLIIQLFENLISNAIKFSSKNQVALIDIESNELSVKEKNHLKLLSSETYFQINIKDNGIGFKEEFAQTIFNIFQRVNGKAEYPGNGIGLAICKKIIEKHNGLIWAHSELGKGAVFSFVLPKNHHE